MHGAIFGLPHNPLMLIAVFALVPIELIWHWHKGTKGYDWQETTATLAVMAGQILFRAASALVLLPILLAVYETRLFTIRLDGGWAISALFLGVELSYYWFHRMSHTVRWLWATHAVHHSSTHLNFAAAFRLGWTNLISGSWLFLLPLVWMGAQYPGTSSRTSRDERHVS